MAKSKESFNKKEKEKKRLKQKEEKAQKMEQRRSSTGKAQPLEAMFAYIDEHGNLSDTPPDPSKKQVFNAEDIQISVPRYEAHDDESAALTGKLSFFNQSKGFGFITVTNSAERVFVHVSQLLDEVAENDAVTFETEHGPRGLTAVQVRKLSK